jgi:hypothetical protein
MMTRLIAEIQMLLHRRGYTVTEFEAQALAREIVQRIAESVGSDTPLTLDLSAARLGERLIGYRLEQTKTRLWG